MRVWIRMRRWRVPLVAILLYLLVMMFGGCADRLILFPSRGAVDPRGAQRYAIRQGDRIIEIWTARSPGAREREPEAFMLEFVGNASRAEHITTYVANRWGHRPVEVWVMNYPGYGGSTGPARLRDIAPAALAAYDELRRRAGERPIIVAGNSLGTAPALYVAHERPVAGLILQNPPPLRRIILRQHGWWNLWLIAGPIAMQVPGELDSLETAPHVTAPAVFLLAGADTIIRPHYQRAVVAAYRGEKRVIDLPDANHNTPLGGDAETRLRQAMDWLLSRGREVSTGPAPLD